jgi:hypothetical protein
MNDPHIKKPEKISKETMRLIEMTDKGVDPMLYPKIRYGIEKDIKKRDPYVVNITPVIREQIKWGEYLPELASTEAYSAKQATSQVVARSLPDEIKHEIERTVSKLKRFGGEKGLEYFAFEVPIPMAEDGKPLSREEFNRSQEIFLASRIAEIRGGSEIRYVPLARSLLRKKKESDKEHVTEH